MSGQLSRTWAVIGEAMLAQWGGYSGAETSAVLSSLLPGGCVYYEVRIRVYLLARSGPRCTCSTEYPVHINI